MHCSIEKKASWATQLQPWAKRELHLRGIAHSVAWLVSLAVGAYD